MTIPTRTIPFKRLAAAVIFQAIRDATCQMGTAKKSATAWWTIFAPNLSALDQRQ